MATPAKKEDAPKVIIKRAPVVKASEVQLRMLTDGFIPWGIAYYSNGEWSQCFVRKGCNL